MTECPACGEPTTFRLSDREHGQPGRSFVVCVRCKREMQAVIKDGKVTSVWGYKGGSRVITLRLSDEEMEKRRKMKALGYADRQIYITGLDGV